MGLKYRFLHSQLYENLLLTGLKYEIVHSQLHSNLLLTGLKYEYVHPQLHANQLLTSLEYELVHSQLHANLLLTGLKYEDEVMDDLKQRTAPSQEPQQLAKPLKKVRSNPEPHHSCTEGLHNVL